MVRPDSHALRGRCRVKVKGSEYTHGGGTYLSGSLSLYVYMLQIGATRSSEFTKNIYIHTCVCMDARRYISAEPHGTSTNWRGGSALHTNHVRIASPHRRRSSRIAASLGKQAIRGAKDEEQISPPRAGHVQTHPPPTQPPFEHTGSRACPGRPANPARQLAGRGARPPAGRSVSQSVDQPTNRPTSQPASRPPAGGPCMHAFPRHPAIACGLQSRPAGVVAPSGPVPPPPTGPPTSIGRRSCVQTFPGPKVIRGGPTRNPDPKSARQLAGPRRTVPITGQPATEAR
jgi:hypothetical protein